jgi:hypothetical protein
MDLRTFPLNLAGRDIQKTYMRSDWTYCAPAYWGITDKDSRLMLNQEIAKRRGGIFLSLTEEQYLKLKRVRGAPRNKDAIL